MFQHIMRPKESQRNILFFPLLLSLKQCFKKKKINYDISHIAFRPLLKKETPEQSKTFPSLHLKLASLVLEADTEETVYNLQFPWKVEQGLQRQDLFWSFYYILSRRIGNRDDNQF